MREDPTRYCIKDGWAYYGDRCLDQADVDCFVIHDERWACDGPHVYEGGRHKRSIDGKTFVYLNVVYVRDEKAVHTCAGIVRGADPKSFEPLDSGYQASDFRYATQLRLGGYGRDAANVFYNDSLDHKAHRLKGADPASFVSLGNGYGRDRHTVFLYGVPLPRVTSARWTHFGRGYSIDHEHAYYGAKILDGVDPSKLAVCCLSTTGRYATDGNRFFNNDQEITLKQFYDEIEEYPDTVQIIVGRWWPGVPERMRKAADAKAKVRFPPKKQSRSRK